MKVAEANTNLPTHAYQVLADSIGVGKPNATLMSDIMSITGIDDRRQLYYMIEILINNYGYVILASRRGQHKGYYYPSNDHEFNDGIRPLRSTVDSTNKRKRNVVKNYKNMR